MNEFEGFKSVKDLIAGDQRSWFHFDKEKNEITIKIPSDMKVLGDITTTIVDDRDLYLNQRKLFIEIPFEVRL